MRFSRKASKNWAASKDVSMSEKNTESSYTCSHYRAEMILLALQRRLAQNDLSESERKSVKAEIRRVKSEMGMS